MGCHGFFPTSYPEVLSHSESKITFILSENADTLSIYPFAFKLTITYEAKDSALTVSATVKNTGDDTLPFMYGAHPGINVPMNEGLTIDDYYIDFAHNTLPLYPLINGPFAKKTPTEYSFVGTKQPLSEKWLKDMGTAIFGMKGGNIKLGSDKGSRSVELEFSDGFEYFCLWKMPMEEATYLCLEPWSGVPSDGISEENFEVRESMVRLCPDEEKDFIYKMKFN
jgi:galactose mutarotase-like enzyme